MTTRPVRRYRRITRAERRRLEAAAAEAERNLLNLRASGYPFCGLPLVRLSRILRVLRTGQVPT